MTVAETSRRFDRILTYVSLGLVTVLIGLLFHAHGNTTDVVHDGTSLFTALVAKWNDPMGSMTHGWLIPIIALYCAWDRRAGFLAAEKRVWWGGLLWIVVALVFHWVGLRIQQSRLSMFSIIGLMWSIPAVVYGPAVGRRLLFPCAYLLLCVPWHFLDTMTFPLRLMATTVAGWILNGLGIPTTRIGTAMYSSAGGGFAVDIADPCSGLRSLLAIVALSTAYAYLSNRTSIHRWLLCLFSVPLVLVANMGRIVMTALLFMVFKNHDTQQFVHDSSGYLVFGLAVALLLGLDAFLIRASQWRLREWKDSVTKRS